MNYQLRLPVVEAIAPSEIRLNSGGSLKISVTSMLLGASMSATFGWAIWVQGHNLLGLFFALVIGIFMINLTKISLEIPRYTILNIRERQITKCSVLGKESSSPLNVGSISLSKILFEKNGSGV